MKVEINDVGDHVCEHGVAMDVHCCNCHSGFIFDRDHECPEPDASAASTSPIQLNPVQEQAIREWAADDRLWTTQDTVEFNLRIFARKILAVR